MQGRTEAHTDADSDASNVLIKYLVPPPVQKEFIEVFQSVKEETQKEEGCEDYYLLKPVTDNVTFYIFGRWTSQAAYAEHFKSAHTKKLLDFDQDKGIGSFSMGMPGLMLSLLYPKAGSADRDSSQQNGAEAYFKHFQAGIGRAAGVVGFGKSQHPGRNGAQELCKAQGTDKEEETQCVGGNGNYKKAGLTARMIHTHFRTHLLTLWLSRSSHGSTGRHALAHLDTSTRVHHGVPNEKHVAYLNQQRRAGSKGQERRKELPNSHVHHWEIQPCLSTPDKDDLPDRDHHISRMQRYNGVARHLCQDSSSL
ncbi:MAG: hypothetical protein FRX49_09736 [Trebouxia sp. A1-2]|nr:MAG: hypothetical protein FRX49_09736 [Trebouxia sp. A1-2]